MYGDLLWSIWPSTAIDSLSHCHNRNLHVFFAQKQYLNHWYSQYIDAFIEGGDIAEISVYGRLQSWLGQLWTLLIQWALRT